MAIQKDSSQMLISSDIPSPLTQQLQTVGMRIDGVNVQAGIRVWLQIEDWCYLESRGGEYSDYVLDRAYNAFQK